MGHEGAGFREHVHVTADPPDLGDPIVGSADLAETCLQKSVSDLQKSELFPVPTGASPEFKPPNVVLEHDGSPLYIRMSMRSDNKYRNEVYHGHVVYHRTPNAKHDAAVRSSDKPIAIMLIGDHGARLLDLVLFVSVTDDDSAYVLRRVGRSSEQALGAYKERALRSGERASPAMANLFSRWTEYRGVTYRSRLESQHAQLYDALGLEHAYEVLTCNLHRNEQKYTYTPDFWLPQLGVMIEVKPAPPSDEELEKAEAFVRTTRVPCCVLYGTMHAPYRVKRSREGELKTMGLMGTMYHWGNGQVRTKREVTFMVDDGAVVLDQRGSLEDVRCYHAAITKAYGGVCR